MATRSGVKSKVEDNGKNVVGLRPCAREEEEDDFVGFSIERISSADLGSLKEICVELVDLMKERGRENAILREKVDIMGKELTEARSQMVKLKEKFSKQDTTLKIILDKINECEKSVESGVKKTENCMAEVLKGTEDLSTRLTEVKQAEEKVNLTYSEVAKISKNVDDKVNKMEKISANVKESMDEVEEIMKSEVKGMVREELKENPEIIREENQRATSIVISGIPEPGIVNRAKREDHEKREVVKVLDMIREDEDKWADDILEVRRVGKFNRTRGAVNKRLIKVRFNTEKTAREVIAMASKLSRNEETKGIYINKDLSMAERMKGQQLRNEAKEKNQARSEQEAKQHFFAVRQWRVVKLRVHGETMDATTEEAEPRE